MRVALVGCGFVGSLFLEEILKRAFAFEETLELTLVDFDEVEERNAANQGFTLEDTGNDKVEALADRVRLYSPAALRTVADKLQEDNAEQYLKGADYIVDAVDNIPTRQLLWRYAMAHDKPLLHIGVSLDGDGSVDWTVPSRGIDTFPLSEVALAGKTLPFEVASSKLPPCELVKYRGLGLNVALAAAKALFIYRGMDAEGDVPNCLGGTITVWSATNYSHKLEAVYE